MDYSMLMKPIIGAVIGYSTNWLAIKMLFKPQEEIRIGKIKVPFTPGVIPRERERIAKSLGNAVGERLLTEEVISKELLDDNVIGHIKNFVINKLSNENLSAGLIMKNILGDDYLVLVDKMVRTISAEIDAYVKDDHIAVIVEKHIKTYINTHMPYESVAAELLPESLADTIGTLLEEHKNSMSDFVIKQIRTEEVELKLNQIIGDLITEKAGALGAMFLNAEDITLYILDYIERTLYEEEVQGGMIKSIIVAFSSISKSQLSDIMTVDQYDQMINGITNPIVAGTMSAIEAVDMGKLIKPIILQLLSRNIVLTQKEKELIESKVEGNYRLFVESNVGTFLDTFELSKIVESEVNAFSVNDVESLIFSIVDKELKAITWFGAVLGLVMGLVYAVI